MFIVGIKLFKVWYFLNESVFAFWQGYYKSFKGGNTGNP